MRYALGLLVGLLLTLTTAGEAPAQGYSLVGVWSTTLTTNWGAPYASVFLTFNPNGTCVQQLIVRAGTVNYYCRYTLGADGSSLSYVVHDYAPKFAPPAMALNSPYQTTLQWLSPNLFILNDASGPLRYVRQR